MLVIRSKKTSCVAPSKSVWEMKMSLHVDLVALFLRHMWTESFYLPLLICGGECLEWSEGSDRLSGERDRLLRCLSCDRLEWSDAREWISEMSDQTRGAVQWLQTDFRNNTCAGTHANPRTASPSLSEALAEGMLSSRSGMFSRVALSSRWTTIFSLPFDLSISFLASIKERFSVTVPLIWKTVGRKEAAIRRDMVRKQWEKSCWFFFFSFKTQKLKFTWRDEIKSTRSQAQTKTFLKP